ASALAEATADNSARGWASRASIFSSGLLRASTAVSASALIRRPPGPVPAILSGSRFSSSTTRRTAGESVAAGAADSGLPPSTPPITGSAFFGGSGCFAFPSGAFFFPFSSLFSSGVRFESSITAITSPIFTSWPSGTFVSSRPDFSATTSVETLSVSSAKSASPSFTNSPDFLCQAETTPLVTDSPTDGTFTSMIIAESYPAYAGVTQRRGRGHFRQQKAESSSRTGTGIMSQRKFPKHPGKPEHNGRRDD